MLYPVGGYQTLDCTGVVLNTDAAVTVANATNAEILRRTTKPVELHHMTLGAMTVNAVSMSMTDTGATDGKVRYFRIQDKTFTVTTDDSNVIFTPV